MAVSASNSRSVLTTSSLPAIQARWRGVCASLSFAFVKSLAEGYSLFNLSRDGSTGGGARKVARKEFTFEKTGLRQDILEKTP